MRVGGAGSIPATVRVSQGQHGKGKSKISVPCTALVARGTTSHPRLGEGRWDMATRAELVGSTWKNITEELRSQ